MNEDTIVGKHIVFYDGVCGLCNKFIQFVLDVDGRDEFRFASLQSQFAKEILRSRGADATNLDTVYILSNFGMANERLLKKSDAGLFVVYRTQNYFRPFAIIFGIVPRPLRDIGYELVAHNRYKIFGKYDTCKIPSQADRLKFIEV